jgi:hypothetical protein
MMLLSAFNINGGARRPNDREQNPTSMLNIGHASTFCEHARSKRSSLPLEIEAMAKAPKTMSGSPWSLLEPTVG